MAENNGLFLWNGTAYTGSNVIPSTTVADLRNRNSVCVEFWGTGTMTGSLQLTSANFIGSVRGTTVSNLTTIADVPQVVVSGSGGTFGPSRIVVTGVAERWVGAQFTGVSGSGVAANSGSLYAYCWAKS